MENAWHAIWHRCSKVWSNYAAKATHFTSGPGPKLSLPGTCKLSLPQAYMLASTPQSMFCHPHSLRHALAI
eukprot:1160529-Pelagomonas_calceolata.AAC.13